MRYINLIDFILLTAVFIFIYALIKTIFKK